MNEKPEKVDVHKRIAKAYKSEKKRFLIRLRAIGRTLEEAEEKLKEPLEYKSFFQEMKESVNELRNESLIILQSLPPYLDFNKLKNKDLIEINAQYRTINHFLIELTDEVAEFENLLWQNKENSFVRYVTKYKKDLANAISFFNIKIIGCLNDKILNFRFKQ